MEVTWVIKQLYSNKYFAINFREKVSAIIRHLVAGHHFQILQVGDISDHLSQGTQPLWEHLCHSLP